MKVKFYRDNGQYLIGAANGGITVKHEGSIKRIGSTWTLTIGDKVSPGCPTLRRAKDQAVEILMARHEISKNREI